MRTPLIYKHPFINDALLIIESEVIIAIEAFRQSRHSDAEAGGLLLGYRRGNHIHITSMTRPQPTDIRRRFRFFRTKNTHEAMAVRAWKLSDQTMDYVGEWHTHPEENPNPSGIDLSEWKKICMTKTTSMVFIIQGTDDILWVGAGYKNKISKSTSIQF